MAGKLQFTLEEYQDAARKYRKDLLMLPIIGIQDTLKFMTGRPGIRYKESVAAMSGNAQFAPYKPSRRSNFNLDLDFRTLETFFGSVVAQFEPNSAISTLLGAIGDTKGDGQMQTPTAKHVLALIAKSLSEHLNNAIWAGRRNPSGDTTLDLFDGFDTIIGKEIESEKISKTLGNLFNFDDAIDKTTAVEQLKEYYRKANKFLRGRDCFMYIPESVYWAYIDDYQARHGALPYNTDFEKHTLEGSNGKCHFVVLPNMAGSKYLKITTKPNLLLGTDINAQENRVGIEKYESWQLTFEYAAVYGAQIRTLAPEAILVGELKDSSENQDSDPDDGGETIVVKTDVAVSFDDAVVTATMGEEPTSQTATTEPSVAVTYSSSDESVATVDAQTGALTLVGAGTTLITASYAGDTTHNAASASYALTVSAQG